MNRLFHVVIVATITCVSTAAIAQKSTQELLQEIEISQRAAQLEMEQSRLRWQQIEAERARRDAEIDRLRMWNELQEAADRAERAAEEQAEAAKKAEEAAVDLQDEMEQAAVRTKNNIYIGVLFLLTAGFVTYIIRKSKREKVMQENQKFGILVIIGAALVSILAVMISDGWVYRFDFLQNLMSSLRIQLFESDYNPSIFSMNYYVDVPTKYVILACICAAAYGLTTYLGITPAPRMKRLPEAFNTPVK